MTMNAPIIYEKDYIEEPYSHELFETLRDELDWTQMPGLPRKEYYINSMWTPYTYGKAPYQKTYSPREEHQVIRDIRRGLEWRYQTVFEVCFVNYYEDPSKRLGWHSDNSPEMDDARPIAIISLGAQRDIRFRPMVIPGERSTVLAESLSLRSGSLCLMRPGMQDTWQHEIPKASRQCGGRISLTFRGYVPLDSTSPSA